MLVNESAESATVTVNLVAADGSTAGSLNVTLEPRGVRSFPAVWSAATGASVAAGRLDVVPADGTAWVLATVIRSDRKTLDADALVPIVISR